MVIIGKSRLNALNGSYIYLMAYRTIWLNLTRNSDRIPFDLPNKSESTENPQNTK